MPSGTRNAVNLFNVLYPRWSALATVELSLYAIAHTIPLIYRIIKQQQKTLTPAPEGPPSVPGTL